MNKEKNNTCVVILTGGKSLRMGGGIKTFEKFNNKIIFDRIFEKISFQTKNIVINFNKNVNYFDKYNSPIIRDKFKGNLGPLAGIHSALYWIKHNNPEIKWLVSIPSDTPFFPKNLIDKLFLKTQKNNNKIILAESNNKLHPVIGLWKYDLLDDLDKSLKNGTRKIMHWVERHTYDSQSFDSNFFDPFFNINCKEDLFQAKEIEDKFILHRSYQ